MATTKTAPILALLLDVGGVLLTNGWDRAMREKAAGHFELDMDEMDERHNLTFDTYEEGKLSLEEYLRRVVFYVPRPFSIQEFKDFMFAQSQPFPEMIQLVKKLAGRYGIRVGVITNEGRELLAHRIHTYRLGDLAQFVIASCFVHYRKPDEDIYRIALDIAQVGPEQAVYIDDRQMFVEVAGRLGLRGIHHVDFEKTRQELAEMGLSAE